jgi:hypothetical protein
LWLSYLVCLSYQAYYKLMLEMKLFQIFFKLLSQVLYVFLSSKIRVWCSWLWWGCVSRIILEKSSRCTTRGWDRHHHLHHLFLFVSSRMLWKQLYQDHEKRTFVTLEAWSSSWYFSCILVILFWHCFQVYNTLFANTMLIFFASSFPSFVTMGCLGYS